MSEVIALVEESVNERVLANITGPIDTALTDRHKLEEMIRPIYRATDQEDLYKDYTHQISFFTGEFINAKEKETLVASYKEAGWEHVEIHEVPTAQANTNSKTRITLFFKHEFKSPKICKDA